MKMKVHLIFVLASLTGAQILDDIYVKSGEMVVLWCPQFRRDNHAEVKTTWTSYTTQELDLTNMSSSEQSQMGILIHERSLVIFRASSNHHGNYSCSLGSAGIQSWFRLIVYTTLPKEYEEMTRSKRTCYINTSCKLYCPAFNISAVNIPNIISNGVTWYKEGESLEDSNDFINGEHKEKIYMSSVDKKDHGVYTCTRSFLYLGQLYNRSFTLVLDVQTNNPEKYAVIKNPRNNTVFHVDLGSTLVIDCKVDFYSDFSSVFWLSDDSFVEMENSSSVFYNYTWDEHEMTASLVFKEVSENDLSKNYTCKLQSDSQPSSFVTITLAATNNLNHSHVPMAVSVVGIVGVMLVTVLIYVKLKIDITLFLRDTLGCYSSTSDGKSYDAFLMCYKSDTDAGLNAQDKKWLENVLEEEFGYRLCIYDRDVLPGKAVAEAVLDCTGQSRTVVLIPTSLDLGPGSGLLSAIHEALVERQTRLVFITTDAKQVSKSESLPEVLQHLVKAGHCITWKGISSTPLSSHFWKELRYYLPPMKLTPKICFLPKTIQDVKSW